ncbi:MAG: CocE/NonD family hydrolase [Anaerolineae bacterium]
MRERLPVRYLPNVQVTMRDGVRLAANITMPAVEGRYPAVMLYSPYHKSGAQEPGETDRLMAERGYVMVNYDARGTGDSGGVSTDVYEDAERRDGYEMVEWIATQPWCSGNVGMWGISYCGVVSWQVAMQAPPHLKAIIVRSGTDDVYTEWTNPGGSPRPYMYENYAPLMTAYNLAPPHADLCGAQWADIWREHLEGNVPWGIGFIQHLQDGPYWRDRSVRPDYDRVQCAVYVIGGWYDWYPTPLLRAFAHLKVPKRALVGPWSHMWPQDGIPGPRIDGLRECLKWFDQFLKGVDTGVLDEPPVTLFVRAYQKPTSLVMECVGRYRHESAWPLARTLPTPMYLGAGGRLSDEPDEGAAACDEHVYDPAAGVWSGMHAGGPFTPWGMATDLRRDEAVSLTYTSEPLQSDLEVTGDAKAVLHVASTAEVAYFSVKLCDVAPDGTSALVTKGGLNATHRNGHVEPEPLVPGQVTEIEVGLLTTAYLFRAGQRIRVTIAGADFQNAWPTPQSATHSIFRGGDYPSRLVLPVAPPQDPVLPAPDLLPSPHALPSREQVSKPEYAIVHDMVKETTTASYTCRSGSGMNTSAFTVSSANPALATVTATYAYVDSQPGAEIRVDSQCVTRSDEQAFHHVVEVEILLNGRRHWQKGWEVSVPRRLC